MEKILFIFIFILIFISPVKCEDLKNNISNFYRDTYSICDERFNASLFWESYKFIKYLVSFNHDFGTLGLIISSIAASSIIL